MIPGKYLLLIEALWNQCAKDKNSEYQAFCVKLQSKLPVKEFKEANVGNGTEILRQVMINRSILAKDRCQVLPYNSRKGAYKVVDSKADETFYGTVTIVNDSSQDINE